MNFEAIILAAFALYAQSATGGAKTFANKLLAIVAAIETPPTA
jgi:hypothetical protein